MVAAAMWTGRGARSAAGVPLRRVVGVAASAAGLVARVALAAVRLVWGLVPAALMSVGAWLAYEPAGFVVAGALLLLDRVLDERGRHGDE